MKRYLSLLLSISFYLATAQNLKEEALRNKLSVLNNRAFFLFPDSAKNIARPTDIMATDHNTNLETRIVYDRGNKRMVFFAQELFMLGQRSDLADTAPEKIRDREYKKKLLIDHDSLLGQLSTPASFDSTQEAIHIGMLLVITPDGTMFKVDAYINPAAFEEKEEYMSLAARVFESISKGTRRINRKERSEAVSIFGTKKSLEFQLPENYFVTVDQKYDFQVIKLHKFTGYHDSTWMGVTIYLGHHASYFYTHYGFDKYQELQKGKFLGHAVDWYYFENAGERLYLKEQKIPSDEIEKDLIVHIAMTGSDKSVMPVLTDIVEKIRLKK